MLVTGSSKTFSYIGNYTAFCPSLQLTEVRSDAACSFLVVKYVVIIR